SCPVKACRETKFYAEMARHCHGSALPWPIPLSFPCPLSSGLVPCVVCLSSHVHCRQASCCLFVFPRSATSVQLRPSHDRRCATQPSIHSRPPLKKWFDGCGNSPNPQEPRPQSGLHASRPSLASACPSAPAPAG